MAKISLTSTHSTGKTTLVKELSSLKEFKNYLFFFERTKYLKNTFNIKLNDDSELISQYIFAGERAKELQSSANFISDRSIWDVCAYTLSSKSISERDKNLIVAGCVPLMKEYDLLIYVDPVGVEIENNGLRSVDPIYRDRVNNLVKDLLQAYPPKRLITVSGSTQERIAQIKEAMSL